MRLWQHDPASVEWTGRAAAPEIAALSRSTKPGGVQRPPSSTRDTKPLRARSESGFQSASRYSARVARAMPAGRSPTSTRRRTPETENAGIGQDFSTARSRVG